jgi:pyrroloquinoline quinone biosynthesis protein E
MVSNPLALIAEITHRCPLHCVYCSNPMQLAGPKEELSTAEWTSVFHQCGKLGMLHAHFTGGEPLARPDLTELIAAARRLDSAISRRALGSASSVCGRSSMQASIISISFQDSREEAANWIAGAKAHAHKDRTIACDSASRSHSLMNLVVHRQNLTHLEEMIAFIEAWSGPSRSPPQYWMGLGESRRADLARASESSRDRFGPAARWKIRIDSVVPDYYASIPRLAWEVGTNLMLINPRAKCFPAMHGSAAGMTLRMCVKDTGVDLGESSSFQRWGEGGCRNRAAAAIAAAKTSEAAAARRFCWPGTPR